MKAQQRSSAISAPASDWAIFTPGRSRATEVDVFVPLEVDESTFPTQLGLTHLNLIQLPRPKEQNDGVC